jgi:membrane glycosyltransferase
MSKTTTASSTIRSSFLRGKAAPLGIVLAAKTAALLATLVIFYVLAFFVAIQVVPLTMGFVKAGSGVTLDMPIETVLSVWIAPALFLIALELVATLVAMRAVWRLRRRATDAVSAWALGRETSVEAAPADLGVATLSAAKKARKNRPTTKTA